MRGGTFGGGALSIGPIFNVIAVSFIFPFVDNRCKCAFGYGSVIKYTMIFIFQAVNLCSPGTFKDVL